MHVRSGYPLYNLEAHQRMSYYPPPYNGGYATPWLWYDGNQHGSYQYSLWESKIVERMNQPAPVTITMWGHYDPDADTGRIYAKFRNDSTDAIDGRIMVVITEDSIYYAAPTGDLWHNHVARDYVPTQNGEMVSIAAGDSVTIDQPISFDSSWERYRCQIKTWIQNDVMQPDSTKEIWQGAILNATELTGIEEEQSEVIVSEKVTVMPNPCLTSTAFTFTLSAGSEYQIDIYDVLGRHIRTLKGVSSGNQGSVTWNRKDDAGSRVGSGVYLYKFESDIINTSGKVIVK